MYCGRRKCIAQLPKGGNNKFQDSCHAGYGCKTMTERGEKFCSYRK